MQVVLSSYSQLLTLNGAKRIGRKAMAINETITGNAVFFFSLSFSKTKFKLSLRGCAKFTIGVGTGCYPTLTMLWSRNLTEPRLQLFVSLRRHM